MFSLSATVVEMGASANPSLLQQALAGDPEAFGELCREHEARLLRQAMLLCGNASQAEELAQETLVEAWKSLRRYNGRCQFFTWLCAILLNRHRHANRKGWRLLFLTPSPEEQRESEPIDPHSTPDQSVQLRELSELLRHCILKLPAKQQQVIHLRFYVDNSLEGVAAALGCSVGTVKSRLFHALENLRSMNAVEFEHHSTKRTL